MLQHVPFEGIGSISLWLDNHGADVSYTRFFEGHALPQANNFDLIIVMGGPMSVNDELRITWLRQEKQLILEAIDHGVSVVGICLGAQLIASALGARVYKNDLKEIGWFQIESTENVTKTFNFPRKCKVFHWHGETFDLPSGAVCLARSAACENQAFQLGQNVIGLQFHLETTTEDVNAILKNCGGELIPGPYIQTESEMRAVKSPAYEELNSLMGKVLSYVTRDLS